MTLFFRLLEYGTPFNEFSQLGELQFYIYPAIDVKAAASNSPSNKVTLSMLGRLGLNKLLISPPSGLIDLGSGGKAGQIWFFKSTIENLPGKGTR